MGKKLKKASKSFKYFLNVHLPFILRVVFSLFVVLFMCGIFILTIIPADVPIHRVSLHTYKHVIRRQDNLFIFKSSSKPFFLNFRLNKNKRIFQKQKLRIHTS